MKLKEVINLKALFTRKARFMDVLEYTFWVNSIKQENWKAYGNASGREVIKKLSRFKSAQFNVAYFIRNKKGYQTVTFQQAYDIVITDKDGKIIDVKMDVQPGNTSKYYSDAYIVYFLSVGTINYFNLNIDDVIKTKRKWL